MHRRSMICDARGHARKKSAGFSLVELMVSVAVSLLLLAGVVAILANSRDSYQSNDQLSLIQETGRYALDRIAQQVRESGFPGCSSVPRNIVTTLGQSTDLEWNFLEGGIRGYDATGANTWTPALPPGISAASGSDVIVLRGPKIGAEPLALTADLTDPAQPLQLPNVNTGVQTGDIALAYNCRSQAYFLVTQFAGGVASHIASTGSEVPRNGTGTLSIAFPVGSAVIPVETVVYYINDSTLAPGMPAPAPDAPPETIMKSLWLRVGNAQPTELVQGVDQMQLAYGVDTDGDHVIDLYRRADQVTDWSRVISVSIALLVRSLESTGDIDQRTYTLLPAGVGTIVDPPRDRRLREVFTTTVSIRSRIQTN